MKCGKAVFLFLCLVLAAWPLQAAEQVKQIKVAFVYAGPVGEAGWSFAHDQGRKYLEKELPGVATVFAESVPEGVDAEQVMTRFAEEGYKVIFATSHGYMDAAERVARKFPRVYFEHCAGSKTAANLATYSGRIYEARYLSGIVAGKMTGTGKIGYVAAKPVPEVVRDINAFARGVRSVNPSARVKVVWTNKWNDHASDERAAVVLLDDGCDVITQHQDSPGVLRAAEERGKYAIGCNSPMEKFAPKAVLTGPVWNWGPYYVKRVKAAIEGTWAPGEYWGPMADGVVGLAPFSEAVPPEVVRLVEAKKKEIEKGTLHPFAGPVKDNQGRLLVPKGKTVSDREMLIFGWFVEGVEGRFLE